MEACQWQSGMLTINDLSFDLYAIDNLQHK
jgi:hypothetical protein